MIIFKHKADLRQYLDKQGSEGKKTGFIPTMGALHEGHISLILNAKNDGMVTVCSVFVNPAQFNDKEDFEQYPSSIEADIELLIEAGCDVLFLPDIAEMYPEGPEKALSYSFGKLETVLEGAHRPGHFNGVGKIMGILLGIVQPDALYMGRKDYQQCLIVKDLCRQMGLAEKVQFVLCPTRREADGLAMSSRNRRLTQSQRIIAATIYQCLVSIQSKFRPGSAFPIVQKECIDLLGSKGFVPEYVVLADSNSLEELPDFDPSKKMIALIAAKIGTIRLIDNIAVNE